MITKLFFLTVIIAVIFSAAMTPMKQAQARRVVTMTLGEALDANLSAGYYRVQFQ